MKQYSTLEDSLPLLGFSKNQTEIYLCLIRFGEQKAGEIIKKTGLQRSVVYTCLTEFIERKLIFEKSNKDGKGVSIFGAKDPSQLVNEQQEKLKLTEQLASSLKTERSVLNHEAYVHQGNDIITLTAEKTLDSKSGETVYFFGSSKFGVQANLEKFWEKYHTTRANKKIKTKILYDRFTPEAIVDTRNTYKLCEARYLPIEVEIPISFIIWEDHLAIVVPGENPPTAFFIKNRDTADALVEYFNYLWKQTKV